MITWPVGVRLGIDDDLEGRVADEVPVAAGGFDRQDVAAGINVVRAVVEVPGRPAILRDQEADARRAGVALAGCGDDDRLVGVVIAGKTAIPPMLTPEVGPKSVSGIQVGPRGAGRQEVGRLPDAAAGAAGVDRVARGIGGVDRQPGDPARGVAARAARASADRRRADRRPCLTREGVDLARA